MKRLPRTFGQTVGAEPLALALFAFAVNFVHIGTRSLAFDEATSATYARLSLPSLLPVLTGGDPNMSLYYLLAHVWVGVFGESETAIRALSAVVAALAVPMVYLLGARLFDRPAALVAALLLSVNAFVVQYAQTARTYALLLLLAVLSSYLLVRELQEPSRRGRISYVIASTLAIYAHYCAAYVLVVHLITLLALRKRAALSREWVGVAAAIALFAVPAAIFASRAGPTLIIGWIAQPSAKDIWLTLADFAGGSELVLLGLLAAGCYGLVRAVGESRWWPHGFVAAWLVLPIVLNVGVSFVQPMFIPYYLIGCVPALYLFGASSVRFLRPMVAAIIVAPLACLSAIQLSAFNPPDRTENWRDSTRYILSAMQPEDAIVFFPDGARKPFEYYERQRGIEARARSAQPRPSERSRIWFVIRESDVAARQADVDGLRTSLSEGHRLADRRQFRRVGIELYVR